MPPYPAGRNKLINQAAEKESQEQVRQHIEEVILEYNEELDYQLLPPIKGNGAYLNTIFQLLEECDLVLRPQRFGRFLHPVN